MHAVKCPMCQQWSKVSREVRGVTLTCGACGKAFVASSQELPDQPAREPHRQVEVSPIRLSPLPTPGLGRPKRVNPTLIKAIIAAALVALLIPIIIIVGVSAGKVDVAIVDPDTGEVVEHRRMTAQQAQQYARQLERQRAEARMELARKTPAPSTGRPAHVRPLAAIQASRPAQLPPASDANITCTGPVTSNADITSDIAGHLVGTVTNGYDRPVQELTLAVQIRDAQGRLLAEPSAKLTWLPPGVTANYSVPCGVAFDNATVSAKADLAPERMICRAIEPARSEMLADGRTYQVSGKVPNADGLANVEVFADFVDKYGVVWAWGSVKADGSKGQSYRLEFRDEKGMAEICKANVRAVAAK